MSMNLLVQIANEKGYKLNKNYSGDIYKDNNTKFELIDEEGYLYLASLKMLRKSKELSRFGRGNIFTKENMYKWVEINMSDKIKIIDITSEKIAEKGVVIVCKHCGEEMIKSWNSISSFHWCKKCSNKGLKYSTENISETLMLRNIKLLSEYKGIKSRAVCNCLICGYDWETSFNALINNKASCPKCDDLAKSGSGNPTWKGGITVLHESMRNCIKQWRIDSYIKYNRCCDISGVKSNDNVIHHHYNFSKILEETLNILGLDLKSNIGEYTNQEISSMKEKCLELHYKHGLGVCLTKELHNEFHDIYGKKNNTLEQYIEFKNNKLKEIEKCS